MWNQDYKTTRVERGLSAPGANFSEPFVATSKPDSNGSAILDLADSAHWKCPCLQPRLLETVESPPGDLLLKICTEHASDSTVGVTGQRTSIRFKNGSKIGPADLGAQNSRLCDTSAGMPSAAATQPIIAASLNAELHPLNTDSTLYYRSMSQPCSNTRDARCHNLS